MSKAQKRVLAAGLLLMALAALFPPEYYIGPDSGLCRRFLYSGHYTSPQSINIVKLLVEWMFLAAMTGFLMICANSIGRLCVAFVGYMPDTVDSQNRQTTDQSGNTEMPSAS